VYVRTLVVVEYDLVPGNVPTVYQDNSDVKDLAPNKDSVMDRYCLRFLLFVKFAGTNFSQSYF